jgi:DNA-binding CsgD family transcriptional regulator
MEARNALLALIGDAFDLVELDDFRLGLLRSLQATLSVDWISLNGIGPDPDDIVVLADPPPPPGLLTALSAYAHQNPFVAHYARTGNGRALRFSDLASREALHELDLYREVYGPLGIEFQLSFTLPHSTGRILGIAMSRRERDFSDAERDLIEQARPFLIQAYRNAINYSAALDRDGAALSGPPPERLVGLGLTRRQAEVLSHIATGASLREIAGRVGISVRTVEKHLELCYRRLGVENRATAAAIAWREAGSRARADASAGG